MPHLKSDLEDYNFPGQTIRDMARSPGYFEEDLRGFNEDVLESCLCLNNLAYRMKKDKE